MSAARPLAAPPDRNAIDRFVYLRVGWDDYDGPASPAGDSCAHEPARHSLVPQHLGRRGSRGTQCLARDGDPRDHHRDRLRSHRIDLSTLFPD